ncbi:MAG: hypothetical protein KatS3mg008_0441 [Acidimicrobiales bacterium]|nr:MAG: hypothetical protein KatS3mg008_0441 [Acidimicrobiales bacterium]
MTTTDLLVASLVMVLAAALQSAAGFGSNLVAAPLLMWLDSSLVPGPLVATGTMLVLLMSSRERDGARLTELSWAWLGRLPGTVLGAAALAAVPQRDLRLFLGCVMLLAVVVAAFPTELRITKGTLFSAALVSGFMATTVSIGGPPFALLFRDAEGPYLRGTLSRFFAATSFLSLVALAWSGHFGAEEVRWSLALAPSVVVGFLVGGRLRSLVDEGRTRATVLGISAASAATAIVTALAR